MGIYNWYHGTPTDTSPSPSDPAPTPDPTTTRMLPLDVEREGEEVVPMDVRLIFINFSKGVVQKDGTYKRQFTIV